MKTLVTTALLAALALTGFAKADEQTKPTETTPVKQPAVQKVTTEQLGDTLEKMGYAPRPGKNKDGKVIGYWIDLTRGTTTVTIYVNVSSSGTNLWMECNMIAFDEKNPSSVELLLAFLGTHDQLWPAYLTYVPAKKQVLMAMSMDSTGFSAAALKKNFESLMDKFFIVADAYQKVKAAEEKAKAGASTTGTPNPLP